jgi:hypothetical protein
MQFFKKKVSESEVKRAKEKLVPDGFMYLGDKSVEIPRVTPAMFKQLNRVMENLPAIFLRMVSAQDEEAIQPYIIAALDFAADEVVNVTSVLTGLDAEYLNKNVGMNEIIKFLKATADKNDLTPLVKNLMSLLTQNSNNPE